MNHLPIVRIQPWLITTLGLSALLAGIWAHWWFWPVTSLGYVLDLERHVVVAVAPQSPAAVSGMQVGDQVVAVYNHPIAEVLNHGNVLALRDPTLPFVPVVVERDGTTIALVLPRTVPPPAFQFQKVVFILLALICGVTGWLLGMVRRHAAGSSLGVAVFWLALGGILGVYAFARVASLPLLVIIQWIFLTLLTPLGIAMHAWFPPRRQDDRTAIRSRQGRWLSWIGLNTLFVIAVLITQPSLPTLAVTLARLVPFAFWCAFLGSAVLLFRAYRHTTITHIRRQMRLIGMACLTVALLWMGLLVIPALRATPLPIPGAWLDLVAGLIPLAYLVGGVLPDVRFLDRVMRQVTIMLTTVVGILVAASIVLHMLPGEPEPLFVIAILAVALYQPLNVGMRRLLRDSARSHAPLADTFHRLTTSLDRAVLADVLCAGIAATFHQPRQAFYLLAEGDLPAGLTLHHAEHLPNLPATLPTGAVTQALTRQPEVVTADTVAVSIQPASLSADEWQIMHQPDIVLWCPLWHTQRGLIGVFLLGNDPTLEPYRAEDVQLLQQVCNAAALAFANSLAYTEQCQSAQMIRRLYDDLQRVQDDTAATIARNIHDDLLNVIVRDNIVALDRILKQPIPPEVVTEVQEILDSEQGLSTRLRMICERLHPTGLNDPYGLESVLRTHVERTDMLWHSHCTLEVTGDPIPLGHYQQLEAVRIVREGINNAVKHADATQITVRCRYPAALDGLVQIVVEDNGRGGPIHSRPGHQGVRNMHESARNADGELYFERAVGGGTRLVFQFPAIPDEGEVVLAQHMRGGVR